MCGGLCTWMQRDPRNVSDQGQTRFFFFFCVEVAWSLGGASGSTGLVEVHGFAQPSGKVHFLHFRSLDKRVILKAKRNFGLQHLLLPRDQKEQVSKDCVRTINIFRSALSAGFLIKLQIQKNVDIYKCSCFAPKFPTTIEPFHVFLPWQPQTLYFIAILLRSISIKK